jgi:hypothetical protein
MGKCHKAKALAADRRRAARGAPERREPARSCAGMLEAYHDDISECSLQRRSQAWGPLQELGAVENGRMACTVCGRWFVVDRIGTHTAICRKITAKSSIRGIFDSTKQRLQGVVEQRAQQRGLARSKAAAAIRRIPRAPVPHASSAPRQREPAPRGSDVRGSVRAPRAPAFARAGLYGSDSDDGALGASPRRGRPAAPSEQRTYTRWREKQAELRAALHEARLQRRWKASGRALRDLPPPEICGPPPDYIYCSERRPPPPYLGAACPLQTHFPGEKCLDWRLLSRLARLITLRVQ